MSSPVSDSNREHTMPPRILIVDDERIVATSLQAQLQRMGYGVAGIASSGEEAIRKTEETRPHLVLMDIVLHGAMDGIETAKQIRSQWNIPVIYATAYADPETLHRARSTNPAGYLIKPFDQEELSRAIASALHEPDGSDSVQDGSRAI